MLEYGVVKEIRRAAKKVIDSGLLKGDYLVALEMVEEQAIFNNDRKAIKIIEDCREAVKTNDKERIYRSPLSEERQRANLSNLYKVAKPCKKQA